VAKSVGIDIPRRILQPAQGSFLWIVTILATVARCGGPPKFEVTEVIGMFFVAQSMMSIGVFFWTLDATP
jgi:hypothetical protein